MDIELFSDLPDSEITVAENIYYETAKWDISEAAERLDKIATFLTENPGLKIEISSHIRMREEMKK